MMIIKINVKEEARNILRDEELKIKKEYVGGIDANQYWKAYFAKVKSLENSLYKKYLSDMIGWCQKAWHPNRNVTLCVCEGISRAHAKRYIKSNRVWTEEERRWQNASYSPSEWAFHHLEGERIYFRTKSCPVGYVFVDEDDLQDDNRYE